MEGERTRVAVSPPVGPLWPSRVTLGVWGVEWGGTGGLRFHFSLRVEFEPSLTLGGGVQPFIYIKGARLMAVLHKKGLCRSQFAWGGRGRAALPI